jgi:tRNA1Val (adenine37-N6)-methyltransferase
MPFSFKEFHVDDSGCGMPVSTDAVILGAFAPLERASRVLDIGAGSGILSLMAAQRSEAEIIAVELDSAAAKACRQNFAASPWAARLTLIETSIQAYCRQDLSRQPPFCHIICNPPYFEHGPQSQCTQRARARHTDNLSFTSLLEAIGQLLSDSGYSSLILPRQSEAAFTGALTTAGLCVAERVRVHSVRGKAANRLLYLLKKGGADEATQARETELIVREASGHYSEQMQALTRAFYLKL